MIVEEVIAEKVTAVTMQTPETPSKDEVQAALDEALAKYPQLEDVPAAVILSVGMYGGDCAGGCG